MTSSIKMKYVVRRGSHTHHTPHSKRVHRSPETMVAMMNTNVTCAAVCERRSYLRSLVIKNLTP